jgi:hypothetical protein
MCIYILCLLPFHCILPSLSLPLLEIPLCLQQVVTQKVHLRRPLLAREVDDKVAVHVLHST